MSVIGVRGVPFKWSLTVVVKALRKCIKGQFEALNFISERNSLKTCYLKLSEKLDAKRTVIAINSMPIVKSVKLNAFVPDFVPHLSLAKNPKRIAQKRSVRPRRGEEIIPSRILMATHLEVMLEMQYKYPGLVKLSTKVNNQLIEDIANIVYGRLKIIQDSSTEVLPCYKLSMQYRKRHPHTGDFQMVLSSLHRIRDSAGAPRDQLLEKDLLPACLELDRYDNVPYEKVKSECDKYAGRIIKKMVEHVKKLDVNVTPSDSEETKTRKKVRAELKKISPFISPMIREVFRKYFILEGNETYRVRVYGEPYLPQREVREAVVACCAPTRALNSSRVYNLTALRVRPSRLPALFALDGTSIGNAKLVIRPVDVPVVKTFRCIDQNYNGVKYEPDDEDMDQDQHEDQNEDQNENWGEDICA